MRTATLVLLASAAVPLQAQTVDHTAFEQLFGEPVTTSATGKPQRASEVPAEMDIITADDIRRSGGTTIPDVLRSVAGIDVRTYGQVDSAVGIRGYNTALNPRVLVLLDGRQVYQDDYGFTAWPLIPAALGEIRQIEIIKGPSAALYGFNAVSGVINIVTFDPLHDSVNSASASGGTQSQTFGEAIATAQVPGKLGVRLSAHGFRSTEFTGSQGYGTRQQPHTGTVSADARVQLAPGIEWDVSGSIGSVNSDYYLDLGGYFPLSIKANSLRSRLFADTPIGLLQLDVYRNENRTSENQSPALGWRQDVTVVQASDLVKIGTNHTIRVAAEFRDNSISDLASFSGRLGYTNLAASAMWDWQVLPNLSFTNAVRIDDMSLSHRGAQFYIPTVGGVYRNANIVEPSFNSGAVLKLTDYDTVRLTAARAVQLPSLVDLGLTGNFGPEIVSGNNRLAAAAVVNYELDYDRALPSLRSTLRLAAYTQHTGNTIGSPFGSGSTVLPTQQLLLMARNFGGSREIGGEIGLKGSNASGLRWNLSYALALVHDESPTAELLKAPSVSYQRQTPVHSIVVGGGYTWDRLELDAQARWQSRYQDFTLGGATFSNVGASPITIQNYVTVNARVGYRVTDHLTASLVAQQLNSERIVESAGRPVERRIIAGLRAQF